MADIEARAARAVAAAIARIADAAQDELPPGITAQAGAGEVVLSGADLALRLLDDPAIAAVASWPGVRR